MGILPLILTIAAPIIGQVVARLFAPRQPGRGGQGRGGRPEAPIPLPQPPITEEDIRRTLVLTRGLFDQIVSGGAQSSDLMKGALREVEKIATEAATIRGASGGMQSRIVADALSAQLPNLVAMQGQVASRQYQDVLNELTTMAALSGRVGRVLTPQMLQFIGGMATSEGQLLGFYNPPFHYGLFSPIDYARFAQGQAAAQNVQNILQWLMLLWPIIKKGG